jgi:hypothetical protein
VHSFMYLWRVWIVLFAVKLLGESRSSCS